MLRLSLELIFDNITSQIACSLKMFVEIETMEDFGLKSLVGLKLYILLEEVRFSLL